jgi:hypothetical protein
MEADPDEMHAGAAAGGACRLREAEGDGLAMVESHDAEAWRRIMSA